MALFTKLFERRQDPYDLKGRWYRVHVVSTGSSIAITHKDIPCSVNGVNGIRFAPSAAGKIYCVIDYIVDFETIAGTNTNFAKSVNLSGVANVYTVYLPDVSRYSELDLYVYMVEK